MAGVNGGTGATGATGASGPAGAQIPSVDFWINDSAEVILATSNVPGIRFGNLLGPGILVARFPAGTFTVGATVIEEQRTFPVADPGVTVSYQTGYSGRVESDGSLELVVQNRQGFNSVQFREVQFIAVE